MIRRNPIGAVRALGIFAVCVAALAATAAGLTVSSAAETDPAKAAWSAIVRGSYMDSWRAYVASLDPATAALARRHDPLVDGGDQAVDPASPLEAPQLRLANVSMEDARRINGYVPFNHEVGAAKPFFLKAKTSAERARAVRCLTAAIYYEAALEPESGQRAVAQVVLNRVRHPEFPNSVCGVVFQGWERMTGCQFSFTCDGSLTRAPIQSIWRRNQQLAEEALNGFVVPEVGTSTFYHADYVLPYWRPSLTKVHQIGRHIFYRWPGRVGEVPAFTSRYGGGELRLAEAVINGTAARPRLTPEMLPVETIVIADASAPGGERTRVRTTLGGRRPATPAEIASINARLKQFETQMAVPAAPAPSNDAVPVIELNKPEPAAAAPAS